MGHFYVLLGLGALVLVAFVFSLRKRFSRRYRFPYVVDEVLFTPNQRVFQSVLERAVGKGYRIYGKVRVADVIGLRPRLDPWARRRAYERLGERRFDFLVCTEQSSAIACAINLAPRSRLRRVPPNDSLNRICAAAKLPFVRFRESDLYSVIEIEEQVFAAMHALRLDARDDDPPREDTQAALAGLSETIAESSSGPMSAPVRKSRQEPVKTPKNGVQLKGDPGAGVAERPRTDPTMALGGHVGEMDEGPVFSITPGIDADLGDDDRLARFGKA